MNPIFKQHAMSDKANTLSKEIREEASKLEECVMWANKALAKEDIE